MCECCGNHHATVTLDVKGMGCSHCVESVKSSISSLKGIRLVEVNLTEGKINVEYNPNDVKVEHIKNVVIDAGYEV